MLSGNNTTTGHGSTTGHPNTGHSTTGTGLGHSTAGTGVGHTGTGIGHSGTGIGGNDLSGHSATTGNNSDPSKMSGQMHAAKGSIKETVGKTFNATNMRAEGAQEHAAGKAEKEAAKSQSYAHGTGERVAGKKDQVVGGATGDYAQQRAGDVRHQKGEMQQDMNRF